jgi:predicted lipid-binding transport protein (Tim44 family)
MKGFLLVLLGLVLGGLLGLFGGGVVGTGLGAGAGIVTGMQAGACLAVEAAKEKGFISADQVGQIFAAAAESIRAELPADADIANSDAECAAVVAELKKSAAEE